eukprot:SAG31_NODE_21990_length_536_cov_0.929062_1_plen_124_part_10
MGKGSARLHSVWVPWHKTDLVRGGLVVLEASNSHASFQRVRQTYGAHDYEHSRIDSGVGNTVSNSGWFTRDAAELLAIDPCARWVTAECFEPGDVVSTCSASHQPSQPLKPDARGALCAWNTR